MTLLTAFTSAAPPAPNGVALITGGSRGLGRALAASLARCGYDIMLTCRCEHELGISAARHVQSLGRRAWAFAADQTDHQQVVETAQAIAATHEPVRLVICNAGISLSRPLLRTRPEEWDQIMETNLTGTQRVIQALLNTPAATTIRQILLISSYAGSKGSAGLSAYAASKAGLAGMGKSLALELAASGIRVNIILPGFMKTDMGKSTPRDAVESIRQENLLHAFSSPEETAETITRFSALPYLTGQVVNLDSRPL